MTTDPLALIGAVGGVLGVFAAIITAWANVRQGRAKEREAQVAQDATALDGYQDLTADLRCEIERLTVEIADQRSRLAAQADRLTALEREREQWHRERAELLSRIKRLEDERAELRRQLLTVQGGAA